MKNHTVPLKQHDAKPLYTRTFESGFTQRFIYFGLTVYKLFLFDGLKGFCQRWRTKVDRV